MEKGSTNTQESPGQNFELIPLWKPQAVFTAWPVISEGLEELFQVTVHEDKTRILNAILAGEQLLWLAFLGGKYAGFVCTAIETIQSNPISRVLWVNHAYKAKAIRRQSERHKSIFEQAFDELVEFAKEQECEEMAFKTTRDDLGEKVRLLGFAPVYVEYRKEV